MNQQLCVPESLLDVHGTDRRPLLEPIRRMVMKLNRRVWQSTVVVMGLLVAAAIKV